MNFYRKHRKVLNLGARVLFCVLVAMLAPHDGGIGFALIVATPVAAGGLPGKNIKAWDLTSLDADVALVLPHGFLTYAGVAVKPQMVWLQELVSYANAALPNWGMTWDVTNITLAKTAATASGGTTPGTTLIARLYAEMPHSSIE